MADKRNEQAGEGWVPPDDPSTLEAIRIDLERLLELWMGLVFPVRPMDEIPVLHQWQPQTRRDRITYRLWKWLGVPVLPVLYLLTFLGLVIRYYARKLDRKAAAVGVAGVVLISVFAWGALAAATYLSGFSYAGVIAVAAAGGVATVSAVLARFFTGRGGRRMTVLLGYPFGVTALFLPPVVAALYSPTLAALIFPRSESVAIWILDNLLSFGGLASFIRATFELEGLAYVGMWFGIAVPIGWALGGLVTLANKMRPPEPTSLVFEETKGY